MAAATVGLLHPGEMGSAVGSVLRGRGHRVVWASEGRSTETRKRAEEAGLEDAGSVEELVRRRERDRSRYRAGGRGRHRCRRRRLRRRRDRRRAAACRRDHPALPLRPGGRVDRRSVCRVRRRRPSLVGRHWDGVRTEDDLRSLDKGNGRTSARDRRARTRRGCRAAAARGVADLATRPARAVAAGRPVRAGQGLAMGRGDGGDRLDLRRCRAPRRLPPRRRRGVSNPFPRRPGEMSTRRSELTRQAARLFAAKGYHGTSIGDLAEAMGVQKGSLYAHINSKQDLLYETMAEGARAFHAGLDAIPEEAPATEKIRLALRSHLQVVADQLDVATVFVQEWRYLEGERREEIVAERRRYEERIRALFREGRDLGELRTDLDDATAALLVLSAVNWAYTWLQPGRDTDELADRFYSLLIDGMRGYATPS